MTKRMDRRRFLARSGRTAAQLGLAWGAAKKALAASEGKPATASAAPKASANEKIVMGLIGCGQRGSLVASIFQSFPDVVLGAVCDVSRPRREEARAMTGRKADAYSDFRDLLGRKDIDAVIVATNDHWHVLPTVLACEAGKDVYLEKPVGTSIGEGRAAVKAARRFNRVVHIGTQQRNMPHYAEAVEIIRSGKLGTIAVAATFNTENQFPGFGRPPDSDPPADFDWDFWLGPAPKVPYNENRVLHYDWFFDYGGGWALAWGVHHHDIVHWALGVDKPLAATAMGGKLALPDDNRQWPDTFEGVCEYPPGPVSPQGFIMTYTLRCGSGRRIENADYGNIFYGTRGTLVINRSGYNIYSEKLNGERVIEDVERQLEFRKRLENGPHQRAFIDAIRSRKTSSADIEQGHYSSNPGHLMNIAWRVGRRIRWDAEKEQIVGDPEANALLMRKYREPWALPT